MSTRPIPALLLLALLATAGCGGAAPDDAQALASFRQARVAYDRCLELQELGGRAGGDPEAFKAAVMQAEDALAHWQYAVSLRPDWPPARRNVERALLLVERLREQRTNRKPKDPKEKEEPPEKKEEAPKPPPREVSARELPADRVLGVLDLLQEREQAKHRLREARRRAGGASVERDW